MARHLLACTCGDCTQWISESISSSSWEIVSAGGERRAVLWSAMDAIGLHHGVIRCKTCGAEYPATVRVDPHANLKEVDEAPVHA